MNETKLTDEVLERLLAVPTERSFEICPKCRGTYLRHDGDATSCETLDTDRPLKPRCDWRGTRAECTMPSRADLASEILRLHELVRELVEAVDKTDARGEPAMSHTDAMNWLLDFADRIRPLLAGTQK